MSIARYYDESKNPEGRFFIGVPQGDIDEALWESLAPWQRESIDADPAYRKTPLKAAPGKKPEADQKEHE